jgi:hypothetical protein
MAALFNVKADVAEPAAHTLTQWSVQLIQKELFMSDNRFANPEELIQQITHATNNLSDQEAAQRYQQILAQLPPDEAAELNALALSQVGQDERRGLARQFRQAHHDPNTPFDGYDFDDDDEAASPLGLGRMSVRAQRQDPALLGSMFGGNSSLGGTVGKAALGALAALLIRQVMNGQQSRSYGQGTPMGGMGGANPLGSILGSLLGGGGGFGGGNYGSQQMPGGLDLGSLLGGVLGSGSMAGQVPQGGGLGSLLGSILGGTTNAPASRSHRR